MISHKSKLLRALIHYCLVTPQFALVVGVATHKKKNWSPNTNRLPSLRLAATPLSSSSSSDNSLEVRKVSVKLLAVGTSAIAAEDNSKNDDADEAATTAQDKFANFALLLALNSGFLNGIFLSGILGISQATGPVTDSWTKLGLALSHSKWDKAWFTARTLSSFGFGAFITGMMLTKDKKAPPVFDLTTRKRPLLLAGTLLAAAASIIYRTASTESGVPAIAYMLVCMAMGIQNSFSSTVSQNLCRTTHMTGTLTDCCTVLGQCVRGDSSKAYRLRFYVGSIVMFLTGGILGGAFILSKLVSSDLSNIAVGLTVSSIFYLLSSIPISSS